MKEMCLKLYASTYYSEKDRSQQSSMEAGGSYSPASISAQVKSQDASQSRDVKSGSSTSLSNCNAIVGSYFDYKKQQLISESNKTIGLANADANKSVGLAVATAQQIVGVANADAVRSVGQSQMYTGIAGAAGNVLAGLFTSGNQKAALKAQAEAEVEKARILAEVEREKMRLQMELARLQAGISPQGSQPQAQSGLPPTLLASLGLIQDPTCSAGSVIILSRMGDKICAYPKSGIPTGRYVYENGRLQKY